MARQVDRLRDRGLDAVHVASRETGAAAARNRGLERAETAYVAAVDDCCVAPDWSDRLMERLRAHAGAIVSGRVDPEGDEQLLSTITAAMPAVHTRPLRDRDPLFTGNMGTELATFRRVGPFDESPSLAGAEDNDWGYRALQLGVPIVYAPEVAVTHLDWRDTRELAVSLPSVCACAGRLLRQAPGGATCSSPARRPRPAARSWLLLRAAATRNGEPALLGQAEVRIPPGIIAGSRSRAAR